MQGGPLHFSTRSPPAAMLPLRTLTAPAFAAPPSRRRRAASFATTAAAQHPSASAASASTAPACDADWRAAVFSFWAARGGNTRDAKTLVSLAEADAHAALLRDPASLSRAVTTLETLLPGASVAAMVARAPAVRAMWAVFAPDVACALLALRCLALRAALFPRRLRSRRTVTRVSARRGRSQAFISAQARLGGAAVACRCALTHLPLRAARCCAWTRPRPARACWS
jgi:hypothetical protein